ncbi:MAG: YodC family protein [Cellvibrionaceae bacterium]
MSQIKKGDTVMLKSGGPIMTVQSIGDYSMSGIENGVLCVWFDSNTPMEKVFDIDGLEIYRDE